MYNEIPTLNIKDIVLVKERPQDYEKLRSERLTKTHDGTSKGVIFQHFGDFIKEVSNDAYRNEWVISALGLNHLSPLNHCVLFLLC